MKSTQDMKKIFFKTTMNKKTFVIGENHLTKIKKIFLEKSSEGIRYILNFLVEEIANSWIIMWTNVS